MNPSQSLTLTGADVPARTRQRIPSLDGLRAVSIMLVLCGHFISEKLFPGGLGVSIFFVISGFLISRLLLAEGKLEDQIHLGNFYLRRLVRLAPVQISFVLVMVVAYLATGSHFDWREPIAAVFYFANYWYAPTASTGQVIAGAPHATMPLVPLWSLSVEEHFYLLLPSLIIAVGRKPGRILAAMAAVIVSALAWRLAMASLHPELLRTNFFYFRTECRLDFLAMGVALACLCELDKGRAFLERFTRAPAFWVALAVLAATLAFRNLFFRETVRYTIQGLAISVLVAVIVLRGGWPAIALNFPPIAYVGKLSYSLYVWSNLAAWTVGWFTNKGVIQSGADLALSFALAWLSYSTLERWFLALRERLRHRDEDA